MHLNADNRLQIAVCDLPFAISKILEAGKGIIEILTAEVVAQLFQTRSNRTATTELAKGNAVVTEPHSAGVDNFVSEPVLENTVLVDPRFMGKSVRAHDRLVGLHHHAGEIGNQT
ncbi:MAG: Uncharacterised protein [Synechococcus sp. MIT S9220]|nr:MAG: Uncharacterised protein [Synechococcus sp. MIT S9220]